MVKATGIGEVDFLRFDPIAKKAKTVKYDVQAVAVIVVALKLLFIGWQFRMVSVCSLRRKILLFSLIIQSKGLHICYVSVESRDLSCYRTLTSSSSYFPT